MARRRRAEKREIAPDFKYNNLLLARFVNKVMQQGKKTLAQRITYAALDKLGNETNREPPEVFEQAVRNAMPQLQVKPRRVGGATYQVPVEVREEDLQRMSAFTDFINELDLDDFGKTPKD